MLPLARTIEKQVRADLKRKMVFLSGPRQCGKTTLALKIAGQDKSRYLNWDSDSGRASILDREFPRKPGILVLDEVHKFARWRNLLKGLFDLRRDELQILVTGSARLDFYRRGGDSLQGRYHLIRMHPLSFSELGHQKQETLDSLYRLGGFPEPFLSQSEEQARRWSREYRSRLIREELVDLEKVSDITLVEELVARLPDLVGSPLSINNLREDLNLAHQTVARWLEILERLFSIFRVYPFGAPRLKALKKESKHYHWDWNLVMDPVPRFENFIACHLRKFCDIKEDSEGFEMELRVYRDREQREVDFVVLQDRKPIEFVECKISAQGADSSLRYLRAKFPMVSATQVCLEPRADVIDQNGIRLCDAKTFLWEKA